MLATKNGGDIAGQTKIRLRTRILTAREAYTAREWGIVQLYYCCGLSTYEIARIFQVSRPSISRSMQAIRRKACQTSLPTDPNCPPA